MRTITTSVDVYNYDELSEQAKEKAVAQIAENLGGGWWDADDFDTLMQISFAEQIGFPGIEDTAFDDFAGITGVSLESWVLDHSECITFEGTLTRENAPKLPWEDRIADVVLTAMRDYTVVEVCWEGGHEGDDKAMRAAVTAAMRQAWRDGYKEMEYKTSAVYALEWIEGSQPEFTADGTFYGFGQHMVASAAEPDHLCDDECGDPTHPQDGRLSREG